MYLSGHHVTRYEYSVPVALGSQVVRLVPQAPFVELEQHSLTFDPSPTGRSSVTDNWGNSVVSAEFSGTTSRFLVESRFFVRLCPKNFPFCNSSTVLSLSSETDAAFDQQHQRDPAVRAFAYGVAQEVGFDPVAFLQALCFQLKSRTQVEMRLDGYAQDPGLTLMSGRGACRDLTLLSLSCVRAMGLMGRFVSGYFTTLACGSSEHFLHAWAEVFLPGYGWCGIDPTQGQLALYGYIPLCCAPLQKETMPLEGNYTFVGTTLSSTLMSRIELTRLDTAP